MIAMKTQILLGLLLPIGLVERTAAAQPAPAVAVTTPPALLTALIFLSACACVAFCFQVYSLVRGGQFSRCWVLFLVGFVILALSQFGLLLDGFGLIALNRYIVPGMLVIMSGLFAYGLLDTKRVLS
jgi:hypothetical protein